MQKPQKFNTIQEQSSKVNLKEILKDVSNIINLDYKDLQKLIDFDEEQFDKESISSGYSQKEHINSIAYWWMLRNMIKIEDNIEQFQQAFKRKIFDKDYMKWPPKKPIIYCAVQYNSIECLKFLLNQFQNDFDINTKNSKGYTLAHYAAYYGNLEIMKILVDNKADLTIKNNQKETPIEALQNSNVIKDEEQRALLIQELLQYKQNLELELQTEKLKI